MEKWFCGGGAVTKSAIDRSIMTTSPSTISIGAGDWLRLNARRFPERVCFDDRGTGRTFTFAETNNRVNRLANALMERGIKKGDRIAILAIDSCEYMETLLASMKLGTIYVPLNYRLNPDEVRNLVSTAGVRWIFVSSAYVEIAASLTGPEGQKLNMVVYDDPDTSAWSYNNFISAANDDEPSVTVFEEDILGLAFTSGTTGLPKGVLQSQRMLKRGTFAMMIDYEMGADERRYSAAPMFHISGMALIMLGVMSGFPSILYPQFDPDRLLDWMHAGDLTGCFLVPTMVSTLVEHPKASNGSYDGLRTILYGAAPMSPTLLRKAMALFGCDFDA